MAERPVVAQYCATFLKPEMLHIYRQISGMKACKPVVFTQSRENADVFPFKDLVVLPKPATRWIRRAWQKQILNRPIQIYGSESRRLANRLKASNASLLHIYFGHIAVCLLPFLRTKQLPALVSFHGADSVVDLDKPMHLAASREMLRLVDHVVVRSRSLAERVIAAGCDEGKVTIHRTGIPLNDFPFVRRQPPPDGAWRFVQACRLIPKKGLRASLRAFAEFARRFPLAEFTIAGEGPDLGELKRLAGELGVGNSVKFAGFLSQDQLRALYIASHAFVHPSEVASDGNQEGVPNSMLEAMATGLPVLATLHGGIPEAVKDGGILVAERDHAALGRAMLDLVADPARYNDMCVAAAREVATGFEQERQVSVLETCYFRTIERWASTRGALQKA